MIVAKLKLSKYTKLNKEQKQQLINWVYWVAKDLESDPNNSDNMQYNLDI